MTDPFADGFQRQGYKPAKDVAFAPGVGTSMIAPNFHPGYIQQWSLSLQQILTATDSVEMSYNGNAGVHLPITSTSTLRFMVPAQLLRMSKSRRPNPNLGTIADFSSVGTSSYNGVDVTYRHQAKSFSLTSGFTWGKALDDFSNKPWISSVSIPTLDHNFRRGRSDYDQNYVFRTTALWTSPKLDGMNVISRSVLGSWNFSGLAIVDAGLPFSVTDRTITPSLVSI